MGKRRTPAELIADLDNKLIALKRRNAIEIAKESPELQELVFRFEQIEEQVRKAGVLSGDGPQGFEYRLRGKMLWITEIEAQQVLSKILVTDGDALVDDLRDAIAGLATSLADGEECSERIESVMEGALQFDSPELTQAFENFSLARQERQNHSENRNAI